MSMQRLEMLEPFDVVLWMSSEDKYNNEHYLAQALMEKFALFGMSKGPGFRWALAGPADALPNLRQLQQELENLIAGRTSLVYGEPHGIHPALLEVPTDYDHVPVGHTLVRHLTNRARVLVCISSPPGNDGALAKACAHSMTDLIVASSDADELAPVWSETHHLLARRRSSRLVMLKGLTSAMPSEKANLIFALGRALLDPTRGIALSAAGVLLLQSSASLLYAAGISDGQLLLAAKL